jgi:glycosyltransferase involved in cell wall biosynthesis
MIAKKSLSFYTNIPAPYQLSFFNALSDYFELTVIYYATTQNGNQWELDPAAKYQTIVLKNNFIAHAAQKVIPDFHFSWQIFSTLSKDKSEYVIVGGGYFIPNSLAALIISKLKGKKIGYFSEALFPSKNKLAFTAKWLVLRVLNWCCDAIFCTGKKAAKSFEDFGVSMPKFVIPYNIDIAAFDIKRMETLKRGKLLDRYKSNNEFVILTSGFLIPRKGMDILIKAVKPLKENFKLIILGGGEQEAELKQLSEGDDRIEFAGFQQSTEIPYFFSIADLFVLASRYDGWGVVINEAIAAGLPVVSSDKVGAAVELIVNDVNGNVCESDNVEQYRSVISGLINNPEKLARLKTNVLELVPKISSDYNAREVIRIFSNLSNR